VAASIASSLEYREFLWEGIAHGFRERQGRFDLPWSGLFLHKIALERIRMT